MDTEKIFDENGQGFIRAFYSDKVERVNPIEFYETAELKHSATLIKDILFLKNPLLTSFLDSDYFERKAKEMIVGYCEKCLNTEIPPATQSLLTLRHKSFLLAHPASNAEHQAINTQLLSGWLFQLLSIGNTFRLNTIAKP